MLRKLDESKVLRDPIHGYIHIEYKVIWDCLNSKEVQRLRRIKQLGGAYMVYHTAEHSRLPHSLGTYEIVRRMCEENQDIRKYLSEKEKVSVMLAALLHDVGHGPFSHTFEMLFGLNHEEFTYQILTGDSEVHNVLENAEHNLSKNVADIIAHKHPKKILTQMISGQLDADRMDYLLRDAYITGTKYGEYDLERVLRILRVKDDKLVIKESAVDTVEDYIMARYHMYWQVYFHPISRSYESILDSLFKRLRDYLKDNQECINDISMFKALMEKKTLSNEEHFALDENTCFYGFSLIEKFNDPILKDLANRIINRHLFDYTDLQDKEHLHCLIKDVEDAGYNSKYYFSYDEVKQRPYQPYQKNNDSGIWVLKDDNSICEISQVSNIVEALNKGRQKNDVKAFYPKLK
ncbi:MAG: HD domain-containing protein [Anaerorhabdus sp.]